MDQGSLSNSHQNAHLPNRIGTLDKTIDRPRVLAIPEILHLIGSFLDKNSLAKLSRVSRAWRDIFLGFLWFDVKFASPPRRDRPTPEVFATHASLVRKLTLSGKVEDHQTDFIHCHSLSTLTIEQDRATSIRPQFKFDALVSRHQSTLTSFSLNQAGTEDLVNALVGCPKLEQLKISGLELSSSEEWVHLYERLWSRMRVLSLDGT